MLLGLGISTLANKMFKHVTTQKVNVVHASAGRVRLQCDRWKNPQTAKRLTEMFSSLPIVENVQASPVTGSLLLVFKSATLTAQQFDNVVKQAVETSVSVYPELESDLMGIMKQMICLVDGTMKRGTGGILDLDSVLVVIFIIFGISKFSNQPSHAASLFYWAYNLIAKE